MRVENGKGQLSVVVCGGGGNNVDDSSTRLVVRSARRIKGDAKIGRLSVQKTISSLQEGQLVLRAIRAPFMDMEDAFSAGI
jgi:hypothetical protein